MNTRTVTIVARVDLTRPVTVRRDPALVHLLQEAALRFHADHFGGLEAGDTLHVLCCSPDEWDAAAHGPVRILDLVRNPTTTSGGVAVIVTDAFVASLSRHRVVTVAPTSGPDGRSSRVRPVPVGDHQPELPAPDLSTVGLPV
ncbi:hypothetical protein [Nocardioides zeae]